MRRGAVSGAAGGAGAPGPAPRGGASNGSARLLLTYGVNDCEAKVAHLPLEQVWNLLKPVDGERGVCDHVAP